MEIVAAAAHFRLRGDHSAIYNDLMPERLAAPITLAGATLDRHRHVCAFFHTPDEEYDVLMPFIVEGFRRGEKGFHIVGPHERGEHRDRLRDATVPVDDAERAGQLEIRLWEEAARRRSTRSR